jgi:hypothetical protein
MNRTHTIRTAHGFTRITVRRRRAIPWDAIVGAALIAISAAMLAAMPWFFQTFQALGGL